MHFDANCTAILSHPPLYAYHTLERVSGSARLPILQAYRFRVVITACMSRLLPIFGNGWCALPGNILPIFITPSIHITINSHYRQPLLPSLFYLLLQSMYNWIHEMLALKKRVEIFIDDLPCRWSRTGHLCQWGRRQQAQAHWQWQVDESGWGQWVMADILSHSLSGRSRTWRQYAATCSMVRVN